ncbi:MAG: inorganic phosphate transporter [Eubacteriaceae bacterium]|jgi:PiT family inorganic phosphate transporter|nr:inorganic phosphate transporter [Eubacteriaceae bacterium]
MLSGIMIGVISVAFLFNFISGFHDTANAIATAVYTKALTPDKAILLAAVMNLIGAMVSEKVAMTISNGLVSVALAQHVILAALIGAVIWNLITWWLAIPSSSSHALIGSLIGATMVYTRSGDAILWGGFIRKVVIPLFTSPLIGFLIGYVFMKIVFMVFANWSQNKVNKTFLKAQIFSSALVAYSHGNNDAQKTMGIITLALISGGILDPSSGVPLWVKVACAATMALGTFTGGKRIMKTMGGGMTKLEPASGFVAQTASALVIELMTFFGIPVSTTQVITTSIMGAGSAKRVSSVKWGIARNILFAWVITLPVSMAFGGAVCWIVDMFV